MKKLVLFLLLTISALAQDQFPVQPRSRLGGGRNTYSATATALPCLSPAAPIFVVTSPTSAAKSSRIERVVVDFTSTGAVGYVTPVYLQRYSAISGGTSSSVTLARMDTNDSAATASVTQYTVAPTVTTVGQPMSQITSLAQISALPTNAARIRNVEWSFGVERGGHALRLQGAANIDAIGLVCVSAAATVDVWVEWSEQ